MLHLPGQAWTVSPQALERRDLDCQPASCKIPSLNSKAEERGREEGKIITSQPLTFPASDLVINNQCVPPVRSISGNP